MTEEKINVKKVINVACLGLIIVFIFMLVSSHGTNIEYCEYITFSSKGSCSFNVWHELCKCNGKTIDPKNADKIRDDMYSDIVNNYMDSIA